MASPSSVPTPATLGGTRSAEGRSLAITTPSPANARGSLGEEAIWRRLREAGFDEETVRRRDKATLIAYVSKLEAEIYDYQCNMGLILLEKKDLVAKYEQIKASSDSADIMYRHDKAANLASLAEAKKREENLKKALGIEKECLLNMEKTLHEIRAESAETKVAYESKLAEAQSMMETAERMLEESKSRALAAEASEAEATRRHNTALRNLQDIESREDELRRRIASFYSDCEAKEKEICLQRQSLNDSQKILHQEQESLMEGQRLLSQREEYLHGRLNELSRAEVEFAEARLQFESDCATLKEEKANFDLDVSALAAREEAVMKREAIIDKKDRELLILQEKISNKEFDEILRLKEDYLSSFQKKNLEFDAEMEQRRKSFEDEIEMTRKAYDLREAELKQREKLAMEVESSFQSERQAISEKQQDVLEKLKLLEVKEKSLQHMEKTVESKMRDIEVEEEEIKKKMEEFLQVKIAFENDKKELMLAEEKLVLTVNERNEILVLEQKLKEEIDSFRAQKLEIEFEGDKLRSEKEKFEIEWELIDEKREELRKEADRNAEERKSVVTYLRNELDSLNVEKEMLRNQFKQNAESLSSERDDFMRKMEVERSNLFLNLQKEREDFLNDIKIQREELESSICRQREDVENYLKEKKEAFDQEKNIELQCISSQKEEIAKELELTKSEHKMLINERAEIARDREQRQMEWSEIKQFIDELNVQRQKLQKQRELLRADREEIDKQAQNLINLEHLHIEMESRTLYDLNADYPILNNGLCSRREGLHIKEAAQNGEDPSPQKVSVLTGSNPKLSSDNAFVYTSPSSAPMTWLRKCAEVIFKFSAERSVDASGVEGVDSGLLARMEQRNDQAEDVCELEFKSNGDKKVNFPTVDTIIAAASEHKSIGNRSNLFRRKRLVNAVTNDSSVSQLEHDGKLLKKLRHNGVPLIEAALNCQDVSQVVDDQTAKEVLFEVVGSSPVMRMAENGLGLKQVGFDQEINGLDEGEDDQPSLGAKIKNFLFT
ncbi:hypothetical protein HPP92_017163 [Vanilla planifolia]|uniref:Nuclear matrix constituent protein 1-like protein n=1 Tax=Vanilla planifolia TaxID=51239 RepID=A0A835QBV4_VANPL|nr:hypothetical protein HPP92_017163 [Vanilla planifolia]